MATRGSDRRTNRRLVCESPRKAAVCRRFCPATGQIRQHPGTGLGRLSGAEWNRRGQATGFPGNWTTGHPVRAAKFRSEYRSLPEARAKWPPGQRRTDQTDCIGPYPGDRAFRQRSGTHARWRCVAKGIATTHGSTVLSLSRPRAFTAPGASGVSSRDTLRRS